MQNYGGSTEFPQKIMWLCISVLSLHFSSLHPHLSRCLMVAIYSWLKVFCHRGSGDAHTYADKRRAVSSCSMQIGRVGFGKGFLVVFLSKHTYGSDLAVGGEICTPPPYLGPPQPCQAQLRGGMHIRQREITGKRCGGCVSLYCSHDLLMEQARVGDIF